MTQPILSWTRVEPVTRDPTLAEGVQARTADPLWMLTRQWQFAAFQGEDAASPAWVQLDGVSTRLTRFLPRLPDGSNGVALDVARTPLEALVEGERPPPANPPASPALAARAGLHYLRLLLAGQPPDRLATYQAGLLARYPLDPTAVAGTEDPALRLGAGRAPDGQLLYAELDRALRPPSGSPALPPAPPLGTADPALVTAAALDLLAWYDVLTGRALPVAPPPASTPPGTVPPAAPPWVPARLEYQMSLAAPTSAGELVLTATEYDSGRLDWSSFDAAAAGTSLGATGGDPGGTPQAIQHAAVPTPVSFHGMPAARWWQFEDAAVDLGDLSAPAEELATLLVLDFALRYGNDFFVVPVPLDAGSVARIASLVVTDTFGRRLLVRSTAQVDTGTGAFRLFELSTPDRLARQDAFVLFPALGESLESTPIEEVQMFRDELANLAWAVERVTAGPDGAVADRAQAYQQRRRADQDAADAAPAPASPPPSLPRAYAYQLRTDVPDNWFPLLPQAAASGDVTLRVGTLEPTDDRPASAPWGRLLGELAGVTIPFEEVPRDGVRVTRSWQYARWHDGRQVAWVGRRARPGRGGGASGLRFDSLVPAEMTVQGPAGPRGAAGPQGPAGESGPPGAQGLSGARGSDGPAGPVGPTGSAGRPGDSHIIAAGRFAADGSSDPPPLFSWNVTATPRKEPGVYDLALQNFVHGELYVIRGAVVTRTDDPPYLLEVIDEPDALVVRVRATDGTAEPRGFMVEISSFSPMVTT